MKTLGVLVGSLRRDSINLKLAKALEGLAAGRLEFAYADIGALPHYNDDLWADPPQSVVTFKALVEASEGVLLVTPEYNQAIPDVLKNAIDWGSRPWGETPGGASLRRSSAHPLESSARRLRSPNCAASCPFSRWP